MIAISYKKLQKNVVTYILYQFRWGHNQEPNGLSIMQGITYKN